MHVDMTASVSIVLPRDAMLARYNAVVVCVCLSVTNQRSTEMLNVESRKQHYTIAPGL